MGGMTMMPQVVDAAPMQESQGNAEKVGLLTPSHFLNYCLDIQRQPSWRHEADKAVDYYDGNQLDAQTLSALQAKGMGPLITNIISPIVNVVLGMEAKTRSDWRVGADSDEWQDVAEAMSSKLHESERETRADRACSDGYAGQIKAGLGWVEAWRNANPFQYPYRTGSVHRREIFWDWRDLTYDLGKARYLIRKRWYDADQAIAFFPKYKDLLEAAVGDNLRYYLQTMHSDLNLANSFDQNRGLDFDDYENWRSIERRRICLYECWYRNWIRGYVLRLPNQDVVELCMQNPVHVVLLAKGVVKPEMAVYSKMRMSIWAGPVKMLDVAAQKDYTPYIPFWGYREDRTGVPYGLIRSMISPQDEVNARRQKLLWILGAKRVEMDEDALAQEANTLDTVLQEISRPDAVVVLNKSRVNRQGAFKVETDFGLSEQQFKIMKDSEEAAQRVVGVFNALLGRDSSTTSGVAISSLVEQGTTALAEINDNYRFARRLVGERLLDMIREDLIGQQVTVVAGEQGRRKSISLNQPGQHPDTGAQMMLNDVRSAKVKVALEDVPSTPAYRQQQFTMLAELTKGLPPQLQAAVVPFIIESSELQKRRQIADQIRKTMGMQEPRTPEEEQQQEQQQQEAAAMQKQAAMLDLAERQANVDKMNAETAKVKAEIANNPNLAGAQSEHQQRLHEMEMRARDQVDSLTAELMTTRNQAAIKEAGLIAERGRLQAELKANSSDYNAANRKADVEKEIAQIEADAEKEVARIQGESNKVVEKLTQEIAKMREELLGKINEVEKAAAEAAAEDKKEDKAKGEKEPAPPSTINIGPIVVQAGGAKTIEIKEGKNGTITGTVKPAKG